MVNLIPEKAKRDLKIEYWTRVVSVWLITWSVALFVSAGVLLPANVLIGTQVETYEDSATVAMEKVSGYESISKLLEKTSIQAKTIVDEDNFSKFSQYLILFKSLQSDGLSITRINMSREGGGVAPIVIEGVADNRQILASFRDKLMSAEGVASVDLPISNLASDKDIDFNITVVLNKQKAV